MKTREQTLQALNDAGLSHLVGDLEPLIRESIRVNTQPGREPETAQGSSRLGGLPDLPPSITWPHWHDMPMSFVAQLNLAQIGGLDTGQALPPAGILYFFYDSNQQDFGSEAVNRDQWKVLYYRGSTAELQPRWTPEGLPAKGLFKPCAAAYAAEVTLPLDVSAFGLAWDRKDLDRFSDFMTVFPTREDRQSTHHRLLGHPDQIQDDMHVQVALEARGRKLDQVSEDDRRAALGWRLLFQVDTDPHTGMNWANNGMLYFWIQAEALKAQDFGNVWLVMQCE